MAQPGDVIRIIDFDELPASVRELDTCESPLSSGVLMQHQIEWVDHIEANDLSIAEKCRRSGITFATAKNDTITAASSSAAGGDNIYYIGDTKEKGLEFIGYCAHFARIMASAMSENWNGIEQFLFEDQQEDGSSKNITSYRIRFASGYQIVALSSNPASIRGLQGIVNVDEVGHHKKPKDIIDAATALIIWGGKIRLIGTHNGVDNYYNQTIKDSRAGKNAFKTYHVDFDTCVENGLYERVCLVRNIEPTAEGKREWYNKVRGAYGSNIEIMQEELDCIPREGSGVALPGVLIEACMTSEREVLRLALNTEFALRTDAYRKSYVEDWIKDNLHHLLKKLPKGLRHVFGSDYARKCDFSIIAPLTIQTNLTRFCPFMTEMHNVPTRQQEQILWYIIDHLPRFSGGAMDATGTGATLAEYTADKYGRPLIAEVILNDAWYRENVQPFLDAFTDRTIDLMSNDNVKGDLRLLAKINGIVKLPKDHTPDADNSKLKRHGDAAIALIMGWFASLQDPPRYAYQAVGGPDDDQSHGRKSTRSKPRGTDIHRQKGLY